MEAMNINLSILWLLLLTSSVCGAPFLPVEKGNVNEQQPKVARSNSLQEKRYIIIPANDNLIGIQGLIAPPPSSGFEVISQNSDTILDNVQRLNSNGVILSFILTRQKFSQDIMVSYQQGVGLYQGPLRDLGIKLKNFMNELGTTHFLGEFPFKRFRYIYSPIVVVQLPLELDLEGLASAFNSYLKETFPEPEVMTQPVSTEVEEPEWLAKAAKQARENESPFSFLERDEPPLPATELPDSAENEAPKSPFFEDKISSSSAVNLSTNQLIGILYDGPSERETVLRTQEVNMDEMPGYLSLDPFTGRPINSLTARQNPNKPTLPSTSNPVDVQDSPFLSGLDSQTSLSEETWSTQFNEFSTSTIFANSSSRDVHSILSEVISTTSLDISSSVSLSKILTNSGRAAFASSSTSVTKLLRSTGLSKFEEGLPLSPSTPMSPKVTDANLTQEYESELLKSFQQKQNSNLVPSWMFEE